MAVVVEGDERGEFGLVPPSDGVEVDGWECPVEEDGLAGVHLADGVGGGEIFTLERFGDRPAGLLVVSPQAGDIA